MDDMYQIVEENSQYLDLCSPTASMLGYVKIGSDTVSTTSVSSASVKTISPSRGPPCQRAEALHVQLILP